MFLVPYSVKSQFRHNQAASTRCSQVSQEKEDRRTVCPPFSLCFSPRQKPQLLTCTAKSPGIKFTVRSKRESMEILSGEIMGRLKSFTGSPPGFPPQVGDTWRLFLTDNRRRRTSVMTYHSGMANKWMTPETKVSLLKDEYLPIQKQYEDFDSRIITIKGWSATLGLASIGAGFQYTKCLWVVATGISAVFGS